jgi:hypothetical protein
MVHFWSSELVVPQLGGWTSICIMCQQCVSTILLFTIIHDSSPPSHSLPVDWKGNPSGYRSTVFSNHNFNSPTAGWTVNSIALSAWHLIIRRMAGYGRLDDLMLYWTTWTWAQNGSQSVSISFGFPMLTLGMKYHIPRATKTSWLVWYWVWYWDVLSMVCFLLIRMLNKPQGLPKTNLGLSLFPRCRPRREFIWE